MALILLDWNWFAFFCHDWKKIEILLCSLQKHMVHLLNASNNFLTITGNNKCIWDSRHQRVLQSRKSWWGGDLVGMCVTKKPGHLQRSTGKDWFAAWKTVLPTSPTSELGRCLSASQTHHREVLHLLHQVWCIPLLMSDYPSY